MIERVKVRSAHPTKDQSYLSGDPSGYELVSWLCELTEKLNAVIDLANRLESHTFPEDEE